VKGNAAEVGDSHGGCFEEESAEARASVGASQTTDTQRQGTDQLMNFSNDSALEETPGGSAVASAQSICAMLSPLGSRLRSNGTGASALSPS
jgi:hypothetical protein